MSEPHEPRETRLQLPGEGRALGPASAGAQRSDLGSPLLRVPIRPRDVPSELLPGLRITSFRRTVVSRAPAVRPGRLWGPILPFFGVLLRGIDAPVLSRIRPPYHPSVGYAREIYVAIAMNGLVDLLGFGYLFRSYLSSWEPRSAWAISACLGAAFATAFSTFAVSLVRKPLSPPSFHWRASAIAAALVGIGLLGQLIGRVWISDFGRFVAMASWLPLGAGGLTWLSSTFGFQDGAMVFTRASVMSVVAYLVAGPLHEVMFQKEIEQAFRERSLAAIEAERTHLGPELEEARDTVFGSCMRGRSMPVGTGCEEPRSRRARADLLVQAIEFVEQEEMTGAAAAGSRTYLLDRAKALDASAVVALLGGGGSGRAGLGPRYQQAIAIQAQSRAAAAEAARVEEACITAVAQCEAAAKADPRVVSLERRVVELQQQTDRIQGGSVQPGAIERALALEAIVAGQGGGESLERAAILNGKLLAAWFLAMVMPIVVLVMKCSAGDKLEPYLRRRWAGQKVDRMEAF